MATRILRKTVAERFGEENRLQIRAAEAEVHHRVTIGELARGDRTFVEGFLREILTPGPEQRAWAIISRSKIVGFLRQEKDSEAFKHLLNGLLRLWGITPPSNTFTPWKAVPGAPVKPETQEIRAQWERDGKPKITNKLCRAYAKTFYSSEFANARGQLLKNLIDRVRTPLIKYSNIETTLRATESASAIRSAK
jgi:hypothetical protein